MKVLVCGGRHYRDFKEVFAVLKKQHQQAPISRIISGGCSGADTFATDWARAVQVPYDVYRADWAIGPEAGPLRNQEMLDKGKPDLVLAFPGGRGTADMVRRAQGAGVQIQHVGKSDA